MSKERTVLYDRVKAQWPGLVVKTHMPRTRGFPDFILVSYVTAFAEVKWLESSLEQPVVEPKQWQWLNDIAKAGGVAVLLTGFYWESTKRIHWAAYRAPLEPSFARGRKGPRLQKPWWAGDDLESLYETMELHRH